MTRRRVVALLQSFESSRHRMMYSFCSIFMRTMASTCRALLCSVLLRLPGAAEMRPAGQARGRAGGTRSLAAVLAAPFGPELALLQAQGLQVLPCMGPTLNTRSAPTPTNPATPCAPGVSMMVRLGQNLYSMRTTISLDQNCASRSSRAFSFSM